MHKRKETDSTSDRKLVVTPERSPMVQVRGMATMERTTVDRSIVKTIAVRQNPLSV